MTTEAKTEKATLKDQLIAAGAIVGLTDQQKKEALSEFKAEMPETKIKTLPLSKLFESEHNLRKVFSGVDELAASMEEGVGVLVPLLVRQDGEKFEIIDGARRYRAAKKAGVKEVPVDVRKMTEAQFNLAMLIVNAQREGLHAMEEAEGFERLERDHHFSRIQIAQKTGKSTGTIHARLKLMALGPEARKAFRDEKFDATVAVPLARIRDHRLQAKAIPTIEKMSTREAIDWLQNQYTQTLKGAPFNLDDAGLLPAAGSCKKCPDRSGSAPGLFEDLKGHDTCTNPPCFEKKVKAAWEIASAGAASKGMNVLGIAKGKQIFGARDEPEAKTGYVLVNKPCAVHPKKHTWKQIVSGLKDGDEVVRYFIPDAKLRGRECYREEEVLKAVDAKWATTELDTPTPARTGPASDYEAERKAAVVRKGVVDEFVGTMSEALNGNGYDLPDLRLMALVAHRSSQAASADLRRGLTDQSAEAWISSKATTDELEAYLYEAALTEFIGGVFQGYSEDFALLAKRAGYDVEEAEKRLSAVVAAETLMKPVEPPFPDDGKEA